MTSKSGDEQPPDINLVDEINALRYLYLTDLAEPEDNILRLVVTEGRLGDADTVPDNMKPLGELASGARPIVADDASAAYEITFDDYIAYAVVNESFTVLDQSEQFEGKLFRIYSESKFLRYISAATIASEDYGGPYKHYGFLCLNHIVEVASHAPPAIVRLRPPTDPESKVRPLQFRR